jgi:CRISPR/Cas system-associated exonuclease Cas4 (RecB family)
METFLNIVAKDLYAKCVNARKGLSDIIVVFPNRRARLFFNDSLSKCSSLPVWSPGYTTIEELFQSQSDLRQADRIEMVTLLHSIYNDELHTDESLDSFWSWGELMLADFDDIDRNLAPADQLFALLREQRDLTDISYLTDEQKATLKQFFDNIQESGSTELKKRQTDVWNKLGNIYCRFVKALEEQGIGSNGMIQRRVIENIDKCCFTARKYVFVGFNSLDKAEKALFKAIKETGRAMFYWDYDPSYTDSKLQHEAGRFLKDNIGEFHNELTEENFKEMHKAAVTIVETSTDNAQARFIPQWLDSLKPDGKADIEIGSETAIVLADESLLQPVLHSIPEKTGKVNITMGYPLTETSLYSLVSALIDMQRIAARSKGRFSIQTLSRVLGNPMTSALSADAPTILDEMRKTRRMYPDTDKLIGHDKLKVLFAPVNGNLQLLEYLLSVLQAFVPVIRESNDGTDSLFQPLNQESLFRIYTQINRLHSLMESGNMELQPETLCRLIRSVLSSTTVPFHGEPAIGMQVMGLIETRNLDFKNVLLLSAQEGTLPKSGQTASFIPYSIRIVFGLTTMQDKSAVSSYNFHHLIQRAENVTIVYNGNADAPGIGKGQMSRYLLQLIVSGREVKRLLLKSNRTDTAPVQIKVEKTKEVLEQLCRTYNNSYLSPSALNTYMDCHLKYYLAKITGLCKPDETDTEIDPAMFGTLFHRSAELAYNQLSSDGKGTITREAINSLIKDSDRLTGFVKQAFTDEYFKKDSDTADYSGIQSINFEVIAHYLSQILQMDADHYAPFEYLGSEAQEYEHYVQVDDPLHKGQQYNVRLMGKIDRMDRRGDILRIVDYKTGKDKGNPDSLGTLFPPTKYNKRNSQAFQILYYSYIVSKQERFLNSRLAPVLLFTRSSSKPTADDLYYKIGSKEIKDFTNQVGQKYEELLMAQISEIFNPDIPFEATTDSKACESCDFASLCMKEKKENN